MVIEEFVEFVIDVPFVLLLFISILTLVRLPWVLRDVLFKTDDARQRRAAIWINFVMIFLDILSLPCAVVLFVTRYRWLYFKVCSFMCVF